MGGGGGCVFNSDSEPSPEQLAAEHREEFRLYGYATRGERDPAVDFDGFLDELWVMVAGQPCCPQPVVEPGCTSPAS